MRIAENSSIISAPPVDINSAGISSNYINMAKGKDLTIVISAGVMGAAAVVSLAQATDSAGTSTKALTYLGSYRTTYSATVANQIDVPVYTAGALTIGATGDNSVYVIEVDADSLDINNDFTYVSVAVADPGVASVVGANLVLTCKRSTEDSAK